MRNSRWLLLAGGAAILVVLFLVLRPGADDPEPTGTATPTPGATGTASVEPTATGGTPEPTSTPSIDAYEIGVEEGSVTGPDRITVAQGERVLIEVEADVADHVHVHTYDLMFNTSPGEKVIVAFRANIPGIFEIELEDAGLQLTELEVTA
jgi:hypothetical protein